MRRPPGQDDYITAAELAEFDLTPDDVRRRCPSVVEYVALDGSPCWLRDDLADLIDPPATGDDA